MQNGIGWSITTHIRNFTIRNMASGLAIYTVTEQLRSPQKGISSKDLFICRGRNGTAGKFWRGLRIEYKKLVFNHDSTFDIDLVTSGGCRFYRSLAPGMTGGLRFKIQHSKLKIRVTSSSNLHPPTGYGRWCMRMLPMRGTRQVLWYHHRLQIFPAVWVAYSVVQNCSHHKLLQHPDRNHLDWCNWPWC